MVHVYTVELSTVQLDSVSQAGTPAPQDTLQFWCSHQVPIGGIRISTMRLSSLSLPLNGAKGSGRHTVDRTL